MLKSKEILTVAALGPGPAAVREARLIALLNESSISGNRKRIKVRDRREIHHG